MALSAAQLAALKTELQTDPATLGYAALIAASKFQSLADTLNLVRAGASFSIFQGQLSAATFQSCLDPTEFAALSTTALSQLSVLFAGGSANIAASGVRTILQNIFTSAPTTKAAVIAAVKRQGSRAEVIFTIGIALTDYDVRLALAS